MPKIIEDIKNIIISEAKRQLMGEGYSGMTLRSVAAGCGIAVGTIYNYFESKEALTASFMLDDWMRTLEKMKKGCAAAKQPTDVFECVYREVVDFSDKYAELFTNSEARRDAEKIFAARHSMLRSQIVTLIEKTCRDNANRYTEYLPEFVAETILFHASERREFSALSEILVQLFEPTDRTVLP